MSNLFGSSGGSGQSMSSLMQAGVGGLASKFAQPGQAAADATAGVLATKPKPSSSVPIPDVTPSATMPTTNAASVLAAGNAAANTIAQRAGRQATILTRRQPRAAPQPIAASAGSDYAAKTLG